jgi:hypothetical protein
VLLAWLDCADDDEDHYARPVVAPDCIEDLTSASSGEPAFDVMLTTYTLFEREGASNRLAGHHAWVLSTTMDTYDH